MPLCVLHILDSMVPGQVQEFHEGTPIPAPLRGDRSPLHSIVTERKRHSAVGRHGRNVGAILQEGILAITYGD